NATYRIKKTVHVSDDSGNSHDLYTADLESRDMSENATHGTDSLQAAKEAAFKKFGEKWANSLEPKEKAAITAYSGPDYTVINSYLRNNMNLHLELVQGTPQAKLNKMIDKLNETIESADDAIQKAVLEENTVLSRDTGEIEMRKEDGFLQHMFGLDLESESGIKTFEDYLEKAKTLVQHNIGTTLIPLAYTSTTIKNKNTFNPYSAIRLEITAPKGTHAAYIASLSQYPQEKEVLLPRESKFKITGASTVQENGVNRLVIKATLDITKDVHTEQTNTGDFHIEKQKMKQWGVREYENWRKALTTSIGVGDPAGIKTLEDAAKSEMAALYYYSSINYTDINTYLRTEGKGNKPLDKVIEEMDTALQKAETPEMLYVYRRVDERAILDPLLQMAKKQNINMSTEEEKVLQSSVLRDQNQKISDEIVKEIKNVVTKDKGTIPEKAYMSTSVYNASSGLFAKLPILIRLKVPKGTHAAYLGGVAKLDEGEVLIARGSDYTIDDVEKKTDGAGRDYLQVEATLVKKIEHGKS
ncbi:ADP-ribosyltransferase, partial [Bacillus cereus]|nr:ADP-ribosyltransferase [Bacillus cereus]